MNLCEAFGQTVKLIRGERNYSQKELADRANLDDRHIGYIERANKVPSLKTMESIAEGLNLPLWVLLKFAQEEVDKNRVKQSP